MSSMEGSVSCEHEWLWTNGYRISVIGELSEHLEHQTYNTECTKCGQRIWAHGRMPYFRSAQIEV